MSNDLDTETVEVSLRGTGGELFIKRLSFLWSTFSTTARSGTAGAPLTLVVRRYTKSIKKTLAITNNGAGALSVTLEGLSGTDFSTTASAATVKAKKTYKLKLTFKPTSAGPKTVTLIIRSNDPETPTIDVSLTGTGQ